jgi:pimeloyl-ACP methyl ester carboxylesterase
MEGHVPVGEGHALWYFDTGGDGEPLVLLHAGIGSGRFWLYQQPVFAAAGYRVVGFSRRGHARSIIGDVQAAGIGSEDLSRLADHLGLDTFHLVATAAGGMVAADFTVSHRQRLGTLVLANTIVGVKDEDYREVQVRLRPPGFNALPEHLKELGPCYRHLDPAGTERWKELAREARSPAIEEQGFANEVTWAALAEWRLPVLVLTGDADLYMPPSVMRLFHGRIPGSQRYLVPDCGHSAYWERPDIFNRVVLGFLERHRLR